jgi:hypothetical protein
LCTYSFVLVTVDFVDVADVVVVVDKTLMMLSDLGLNATKIKLKRRAWDPLPRLLHGQSYVHVSEHFSSKS